MAATVAGPEPEMAAKNMQVATEAMAMPPGRAPSISSATARSRSDKPPSPMKMPAATKNGMAMMGKLSMEVKLIWAI